MTDAHPGKRPETLLITLTGTDRPGVTSAVFAALSSTGVEVLDIEQIVLRGRLILGVLVTQPRNSRRIVEAVQATASALGMSVDIDQGVGDNKARGEGRSHVTVIGTPLSASAMAAVAGRIADAGANIDRIERMARYPVTAIDLHVSGAVHRGAAHRARRRGGPPGDRHRRPARLADAPRHPADRDGRRLHADPGRGDRDARRPRRLRARGRGDHRGRDARRDRLRGVPPGAGGAAGGRARDRDRRGVRRDHPRGRCAGPWCGPCAGSATGSRSSPAASPRSPTGSPPTWASTSPGPTSSRSSTAC